MMADNAILGQSTNNPNIQYFPDWLLELQQEIQKYHPHLIKKWQLEDKDYIEALAAIGAELNVVIDGVFTPQEQEALARLLTQRLKNRRSLLILPT